MAIDALSDLSVPERLRLTRLRKRMSLRDAASDARDLLPSWVPMSREIIRRLEAGLIQPADINPLQVLALAKVYEVDPIGLFHDGGRGFEMILDLVRSTAVSTSDQGESWNVCFSEIRVPIPA